MKADNTRKYKAFIKQFENKQLWQIDGTLESFINEIVTLEVNAALDSAAAAVRGQKHVVKEKNS